MLDEVDDQAFHLTWPKYYVVLGEILDQFDQGLSYVCPLNCVKTFQVSRHERLKTNSHYIRCM